MVRGGDEDGVDIGALQEFLVVQVRGRARGFAGSLSQAFAIDVAYRDNLNISARFLAAQASVQVISAARTNADLADVDAIVGADYARGSHGRAGQSYKASSAEFVRHTPVDCIRSAGGRKKNTIAG
jgi:hypothetical protein